MYKFCIILHLKDHPLAANWDHPVKLSGINVHVNMVLWLPGDIVPAYDELFDGLWLLMAEY